jgi:signal transduction histidine kinase
VGVIALLSGLAWGLFGFRWRRESRARLKLSDYHLATQEASAAAEVEILRLKDLWTERTGGADGVHQTAGQRSSDFDMRLHLIRYGLAASVDDVTARQRKYAQPIFAGTVARIDRFFREIDEHLDPAKLPPRVDAQELYLIDSLFGSWEQLRRLHEIEFRRLSLQRVERARLQEELIAVFLWVVLPASALLIYQLARVVRQTITLQERAERQYRELAGHLEGRVLERTAELKLAHERLARKERLALLGQVTGTVSHELRNPLATLRLSVDALGRLLGSDPKLRPTIERLERSLDRCNQVVSDLLDFSRSPPPNPVPTDVASWIQEVVGDQCIPSWLELTYELPPVGTVLHLDRNRLRRAIINVVDNAIQAMEGEQKEARESPAMRLAVRCAIREQRLFITVVDTGPGMTPEILSQIFEPLFTTKVRGIGLGMPAVRQIMENAGGGIEIVSAPGEGTQVTLWLPLHPSDRSDQAEEADQAGS